MADRNIIIANATKDISVAIESIINIGPTTCEQRNLIVRLFEHGMDRILCGCDRTPTEPPTPIQYFDEDELAGAAPPMEPWPLAEPELERLARDTMAHINLQDQHPDGSSDSDSGTDTHVCGGNENNMAVVVYDGGSDNLNIDSSEELHTINKPE